MAALADTTDLAGYLGVDGFTTFAEAAQAELALESASAVVRERTGQQFTTATGDVVTFRSGLCDEWLILPQRPVTAVTSVKVNQIPVTDYTLVGDRLWRYQGWADIPFGTGPQTVEVTYDHGSDIVPELVKGAVLAVAAETITNPAGLAGETIDDYTWRRSEGGGESATEQLLKLVDRRYGRKPLTVQLR